MSFFVWDTRKHEICHILGIREKSTSENLRENQLKNYRKVEKYILDSKIIPSHDLDNKRATLYYSVGKEFDHIDGFFVAEKYKNTNFEGITATEKFAQGIWVVVEYKGQKKEIGRVPKYLDDLRKWSVKKSKKLSSIDSGSPNLVEWFVKDKKLELYSLGMYWRIEDSE